MQQESWSLAALLLLKYFFFAVFLYAYVFVLYHNHHHRLSLCFCFLRRDITHNSKMPPCMFSTSITSFSLYPTLVPFHFSALLLFHEPDHFINAAFSIWHFWSRIILWLKDKTELYEENTCIIFLQLLNIILFSCLQNTQKTILFNNLAHIACGQNTGSCSTRIQNILCLYESNRQNDRKWKRGGGILLFLTLKQSVAETHTNKEENCCCSIQTTWIKWKKKFYAFHTKKCKDFFCIFRRCILLWQSRALKNRKVVGKLCLQKIIFPHCIQPERK